MTAQDAYLAAYLSCKELLRDIETMIHDLPAPDAENPINWGHVDEMRRIASDLRDVANRG